MHQTFYVGIDEEITSVVEKLKKTPAREIIMVVPKRALLIQSIINLRILKKEADEAGIQLMMVTQDKLGKILVEKAGILVQQKTENLNGEEINWREEDGLEEATPEGANQQSKNRLDQIGSNDFCNENVQPEKKLKISDSKKDLKEEKKEILTNRELVSEISDIKKDNWPAKIDLKNKSNTLPNQEKPSFYPTLDFKKEEVPSRDKIENFFFSKNQEEKIPPKENLKDYKLPSKTGRWFLFFGIFCLLFIAFIGAYLFFPKAEIIIIPETKLKSIDSEALGSVGFLSVDNEKETIPARLVEVEQEISKNFDATGDKAVSNQKARGKITIYNEFSSNSQSLVATTRFLSQDGKLFRLISGVEVPGMTKEGDKNIPGQIEAEVMADQAGEEFNIDPSNFTIPGFKDSGNEKYNKFYGKSSQKMTGGGKSQEKVSSITESDIASAKSQILSDLNDLIKQKLNEAAGEGAIILEDAVNKEEAAYKSSNLAGETVENFALSAQMKISALVINEKDIKKLVAYLIAKAGDGQMNIDENSIKLNFGKSETDFKAGTINLKFHAEGKLKPNFNLEDIQKEILGKSEADLKAYLAANFSDIENIEISYSPYFITGRIPFFIRQVEVKLDN